MQKVDKYYGKKIQSKSMIIKIKQDTEEFANNSMGDMTVQRQAWTRDVAKYIYQRFGKGWINLPSPIKSALSCSAPFEEFVLYKDTNHGF